MRQTPESESRRWKTHACQTHAPKHAPQAWLGTLNIASAAVTVSALVNTLWRRATARCKTCARSTCTARPGRVPPNQQPLSGAPGSIVVFAGEGYLPSFSCAMHHAHAKSTAPQQGMSARLGAHAFRKLLPQHIVCRCACCSPIALLWKYLRCTWLLVEHWYRVRRFNSQPCTHSTQRAFTAPRPVPSIAPGGSLQLAHVATTTFVTSLCAPSCTPCACISSISAWWTGELCVSVHLFTGNTTSCAAICCQPNGDVLCRPAVIPSRARVKHRAIPLHNSHSPCCLHVTLAWRLVQACVSFVVCVTSA